MVKTSENGFATPSASPDTIVLTLHPSIFDEFPYGVVYVGRLSPAINYALSGRTTYRSSVFDIGVTKQGFPFERLQEGKTSQSKIAAEHYKNTETPRDERQICYEIFKMEEGEDPENCETILQLLYAMTLTMLPLGNRRKGNNKKDNEESAAKDPVFVFADYEKYRHYFEKLIEPDKKEFPELKERSRIILEACDKLCEAAKQLQRDSIEQSILTRKNKIEDNPDDDTGQRYGKQIEALRNKKDGWKIEINSLKKDDLMMVDFGMKLQFIEQVPFQALTGINTEMVFQRPQARGNQKIQPNHNPTELKKAPQGSTAINNSLKKMLCDFKEKLFRP